VISKASRPWTARSIGSAFQHSIFYTIIRLGGRRWAYVILVFVVAWYVLFNSGVRKRCGFYLSRRFPGASPTQSLLNSYRLSLALGQVLVDRAVLGILGPQALNCGVTGREQLNTLLAEGRGLILVTAHVGCWQLGMASLGKLNSPINLLIHREEGDVDRHFFEHGDQAPPYRIIDPSGYLGGTLEMLLALENQEVLCIMGDRALGGVGSTVEVEFLGGPVPVPFSPYRLASASGAPIAVIFPHRSGADSYSLEVARIIRVPENLGRAASAYRPYAEQYTQTLEKFVEEFPFQFFNFFDMWTKPPSEPDPSR
jgi:predicted LPLAT superfamily acyltransferase